MRASWFGLAAMAMAVAACGDGTAQGAENRSRKAAPAAASQAAAAAAGVDQAAPGSAPGVYVIYDSSNSMWATLPDGSRRFEAARTALSQFLSGDFDGRQLAFRAYGHRRANDCRDSELIAPFGSPQQVASRVAAVAPTLRPTGKTPIDWSLRQALGDFGERSGDIILISDGIESCDADPCALAREWRDRNIAVRIHVVGLGLDARAREAMMCIAAAQGTQYRDAQSAAGLAESLGSIRTVVAAPSLSLEARTQAGATIRAVADVRTPAGQTVRLQTDGRLNTTAGRHRLSAGVLTANGALYRPVAVEVTVGSSGETRAQAVVVEPPRVSARFQMAGVDHRGATVEAWQGSRKVFDFRAIDSPYLDEGVYEFRTRVGDQTLTATERFGPGDNKTIVFGLAQRVTFGLRVTAAHTGEDMRHNFLVLRGGEEVALGHSANGAVVAPGTYDFVFDSELTPYRLTGVVVGDRDETRTLVMPAGAIRVIYRNAAGGPTRDAGFHIGRLDERGVLRGERVFSSASRTSFLPGRYQIRSRLNSPIETRVVDLKDGDRVEIVFRGP